MSARHKGILVLGIRESRRILVRPETAPLRRKAVSVDVPRRLTPIEHARTLLSSLIIGLYDG
jgi:hypothetical protein